MISSKHQSGPFSSQAASRRTSIALRAHREAKKQAPQEGWGAGAGAPESSARPVLPGASSGPFPCCPRVPD